jgi:hypothetical protein
MFTAQNDYMPRTIATAKIDDERRAAAQRRQAAEARANRRAARRAGRPGHGPISVRRFRLARRQA